MYDVRCISFGAFSVCFVCWWTNLSHETRKWNTLLSEYKTIRDMRSIFACGWKCMTVKQTLVSLDIALTKRQGQTFYARNELNVRFEFHLILGSDNQRRVMLMNKTIHMQTRTVVNCPVWPKFTISKQRLSLYYYYELNLISTLRFTPCIFIKWERIISKSIFTWKSLYKF